jgi:phage head maturation protease
MADDDRRRALASIEYPQMVIHRTVPLEDISIKPGDGRTVEAYLAVFDTEAEIRDPEGHYNEVIDRSAFNDAIYTARPQGSRTGWKTSVYYNHALTPYGTPSERWSAPVAVTQDLIVESRGVRAIDRYADTPDGNYALELVRNGAVKGYSFTGALKRSDPMRPPRGGFRPRNGVLPTVRRLVLGLSEYGPTPEPAYETAGVLGMRADFARRLLAAGFTPEELAQLVSSTPDGETEDVADTFVDTKDVTDERHAVHSARQSPFARRLSVALTARGIRSDGNEAAGHRGTPDGDPR